MSGKDLSERLNKLWEEYVTTERTKKYPNIMLLGISGAGKSSLVNTIFGIDIAKTSNTTPETEGYTNFYDGHDYSRKINLIDTAGYEMDQSGSYLENIQNALEQEYDDMPITVIWYCLSIANERIEPIDLRVINHLRSQEEIQDKLCIVFTHCDEDDEHATKETSFKEVLRSNGLKQLQTFSVSSDKELPLELDKLIQWSADKIQDEDFRASFIGSQMADLNLKETEATKYINNTCKKVGEYKFVQTITNDDGTDALAEYQFKMITKVYSIYGVDCLEGIITGIKTSKLIRLSDKFVDVLCNIFPKYKGAIRYLGVAGATLITKVIGFAISRLCYSYVEKHIHGEIIDAEEFFTEDEPGNIVSDLYDLLTDTASNKLESFAEKMLKRNLKK